MRRGVARRALGMIVLTLASGASVFALAARKRHDVVDAGDAATLTVERADNAMPRDALVTASPARSDPPARRDARRLHASAALLAACVLGDSAIEHYRGAFENPGMYAPLLASATTLICALHARFASHPRASRVRTTTYLVAIAVGAAGLGFHAINVRRREGGFSWLNLFYGAPLLAPGALAAAGATGVAAERTGHHEAPANTWFGGSMGRVLAMFTSIGLAATSAEAALLHFRGAFHNPVMWAPVAIPPLAASLLAFATARVNASARALARAALRLTALLGIAGVAMHGYGISRAMGGFRNASQNVVDGPPLPAPPSFTALAGIGLVGLSIMERQGTDT